MNQNLQESASYKLEFHGQGNSFFSVIIVNWLLTVLTLGFYYPWAKAKKLQFLYGETSLNDDRFAFHGTGKEMFKGFIKVLLLVITLYGIMGAFIYYKMIFVGLLVFYLGFFAVMPLAIHGSYRYRMSRTSWRGIRFGYRGDRNELTVNFFKWILLTIITLGFYGPWMSMKLRSYVLGNIRLGNAEFNYEGDGMDYLVLNIKGYFLTIFTLGIYAFWWQKELFDYYINHLSLNKDGQEIRLNSTVTGGGFFKLGITNILILIFTLGMGYAWVMTRSMKYIFDNIELEGNIDLNSLHQTEDNYKDAAGEDVSDFLNLDIIM